jgi:signal transduction histidine kinase
MKKLALISFFLCTGLHTWCQQRAIDSLENELKGKLADTSRAKSLLQLAMIYETVDSSKSIQTYQTAVDHAVGKHLDFYSGLAYFNRSFIQSQLQHYDMAMASLDTALYFLGKSKDPNALFRTGQVYDAMSNISKHQGDYKAAVDFLFKGIDIFEKTGRTKNLVISLINLSMVYKLFHEFDKQKEYGLKALNISRTLADNEEYVFASMSQIAHALSHQGHGKEAKVYIDSAMLFHPSSREPQTAINFYSIKGFTEMNLNLLDEAYGSFSEGYRIARSVNELYSITQTRLQMSRVLTLQKKFTLAKPLLDSSYQEAMVSKDPSLIEVALACRAGYYEESGDVKLALKYYIEYKQVADSLASVQNKEFSATQEVKYETAKKQYRIVQLETEKQIQDLKLKQRNVWNYILGASALLALLIAFLTYRNYDQKRKLQALRITELETEKQLTATEAVLKGEEQERTRLAKDLHDGLGGMLSGIKHSFNTMKGNLIMTPENAQAFEHSMNMLDSSIREMRRVAHNMMPEALVKFGLDAALKDFCQDINQAGALAVRYQSIGLENATLDQTTSITIYRIIQELINNTLKHAQAKNALVQVSHDPETLSITVEDDGRGFDKAVLQQSKGIGWSNIQNRVEFLKADLDVQTSADRGTSVQIDIKL